MWGEERECEGMDERLERAMKKKIGNCRAKLRKRQSEVRRLEDNLQKKREVRTRRKKEADKLLSSSLLEDARETGLVRRTKPSLSLSLSFSFSVSLALCVRLLLKESYSSDLGSQAYIDRQRARELEKAV